jgi:hypothetical protein
MRRRDLVLGILSALSVTYSQATFSCDRVALTLHTIDPTEKEIDRQAPGRVEARLAHLLPGDGYDFLTGDDVFCIGDASAGLQILRAEDNRTTEEHMGFRLILVEGDLPDETYLPREPVRAYRGFLSVMWLVGRLDPIEAVDFTIAIAAVDLAGNEGPMSEPIRIAHPRMDR